MPSCSRTTTGPSPSTSCASMCIAYGRAGSPVRILVVPDHVGPRRLHRFGVAPLRSSRTGGGRRVLARVAAARRPHGARLQGLAGRGAGRRSGRLQRPQRRPRVRRRRLLARRRDESSSRTSTTSASTAWTRSAPSRGRSRPSRRSRARLRYADGIVVDGTIVCVRERHEDEVVNELVSLPADGSAEPTIIASGHDFFSSPSDEPRRNAARLPELGPSAAPVHRHRPVGRGARRRAAPRGRGAGGVDLPARSGARTGRCTSSPTAPAGGTSTASGTGKSRRWLRSKPSSAGCNGYSGCPATSSSRTGGSPASSTVASRQPLTFIADGEYEDAGVPYDCAGSPILRGHGSKLAWVAASATEPPLLALLDARVERARGPEPRAWRSSSTTRSSRPPSRSSSRPTTAAPATPSTTRRRIQSSPARPTRSRRSSSACTAAPRPRASPAPTRPSSTSPAAGIAVVDVNYGGSTGYGREYTERLKHRWGPVDTADSIAVARYLAERGDVDGERVAITGGSAGRLHHALRARLRGLLRHRRKLLRRHRPARVQRDDAQVRVAVRPLADRPIPEDTELYKERSPATAADDLRVPVLLLQGLDDKVVPPSQAEIMVDALRRNGVPFAYIALRGRGTRLPQGREHPPLERGLPVVLLACLRLRAGGRATAAGDREPVASLRVNRRCISH